MVEISGINMGIYNFGMAYGMPPIVPPYGHKEEVPIGFGFGPIGTNM
jgi:hypothetical protein